MNQQLDQVQLVDEHDAPIGVMDKLEAHRGDGKRHRAISVFLFNAQGELLIQKRSSKKIVGALQWANTCCGNVWPGETREACAQRRLSFELGIINVKIVPLYTFEYHLKINEGFSEWEIDEVFVGRFDSVCTPNPDEVADWRWISKEKLDEEIEKNTNHFAPWFLIMMDVKKMRRYWEGLTT